MDEYSNVTMQSQSVFVLYPTHKSQNNTSAETVDRDILKISRNGDRKIMEFMRITSEPPRVTAN